MIAKKVPRKYLFRGIFTLGCKDSNLIMNGAYSIGIEASGIWKARRAAFLWYDERILPKKSLMQ